MLNKSFYRGIILVSGVLVLVISLSVNVHTEEGLLKGIAALLVIVILLLAGILRRLLDD